MILRDAILSDHVRPLTPARSDRTVVPLERPDSVQIFDEPVAHPAALAASVAEDLVPMAAPLIEVQSEPEPDPLTFEMVVAWLAVQDGETRKACVSVLADELTQVHEAAREEGFATGRTAGRKAADAEFEQLYTQLQDIVDSSSAALDREAESVSELCVDIVGEAFRKIAGPLLATPEAIGAAVSEVLARVKEGRELTVRVNPADLRTLQECGQQEKLAAVLGGRKFTMAPDSRVELGGCIVESKLGSLDGRLEVQLRELYETLRLAKSTSLERT